MDALLELHPENPQPRQCRQIARAIADGSLIAYPTESGYAIGGRVGDRRILERIGRIRQFDKPHNYTLFCQDLSEIAQYAKVDNQTYRLLKRCFPGPYTFILQATSEVPRLMLHAKKKKVGIRVSAHPFVTALCDAMGQAPLLSTSLIPPGEKLPLFYADDVQEQFQHDFDIIVDAGPSGFGPTTVIDAASWPPEIRREGLGDIELVL